MRFTNLNLKMKFIRLVLNVYSTNLLARDRQNMPRSQFIGLKLRR